MERAAELWPDLAYPQWRDTAITLQLWTQIVGKIRLALTPWVNHSWQVPLYVSARGLATGPIPTLDKQIIELEFDFHIHQLLARTSRGGEARIDLPGQSVAEFYRATLDALRSMGVVVAINDMPNEMPDPVRFGEDRAHATYDRVAAQNFWRALIQADRLFKLFRSGFLGKVSPVHFFWGSFDLAVTRFSGRIAPPHPGGVPHLPDAVAREAYSHEVSSAGFWPGSDAFPHAAFYSYAYPEPPDYRTQRVTPGAAFEPSIGEFILPYDTVRAASDPDALLLDFLATTYVAAADCGRWDRAALECELGVPGKVRPV
jgi:uncharacterized protein DUF5996